MSYTLSTPTLFKGSGQSTVKLQNTSTAEQWTHNVSNDGKYHLSSVSTSDVLTASPSGGVNSSMFRAVSSGGGGNYVGYSAPNGMVTSYTYTAPASTPIAGQTIVFDGANYVWASVFGSVNNFVVVSLTPGPGEYGTLSGAIASIPTIGPDVPSATNKWVVYMYPGLYSESAMVVVPSYVYIVGADMSSCQIQPSATGYDLLKFSHESGASFITIMNVASPNYGMRFTDVADDCVVHKVQFESCDYPIICSSSAMDFNHIFLEYIKIHDCIKGIVATAAVGNRIFLHVMNVIIEDMLSSGFECNNADVSAIILSSHVHSDDVSGIGTGITLNGGAHASVQGMIFKDLALGFTLNNDSTIQCSGSSFDGCTSNINIASATASGFFNGYSEYTKTTINPASSFFITNQDLNVITVAKRGGNFSTVTAAVSAASALTPSVTNQFVISVGPGVFNETDFTIPSFVTISGAGPLSTTLNQTTTSGTRFITMASGSSIQSISLANSSYTGSGGGDFAQQNVLTSGAVATVYIGLHNSSTNTVPTHGVYFSFSVTGIGATSAFPASVTISSTNNGSTSSQAAATTFALNTWYRLGIVVTGTTSVAFYVNGVQVGTSIVTNLPTLSAIATMAAPAFFTSKSGTATNVSTDVWIDYVNLQCAIVSGTR